MALIGVGLVAGFINTVAGGGSMLSLPLLMFLGLPANVANGTNRIAILLQNIIGVNTFRKNKILDLKTDYRLAIPAIVGSIAGAMLAVELNEEILRRIIAVLMIFMLLIVILKPEVWVKEKAGSTVAKPSAWQYLIFFADRFLWRFYSVGSRIFIDCRSGNGLRLRPCKDQCRKSVYRFDLYNICTWYFCL